VASNWKKHNATFKSWSWIEKEYL